MAPTLWRGTKERGGPPAKSSRIGGYVNPTLYLAAAKERVRSGKTENPRGGGEEFRWEKRVGLRVEALPVL